MDQDSDRPEQSVAQSLKNTRVGREAYDLYGQALVGSFFKNLGRAMLDTAGIVLLLFFTDTCLNSISQQCPTTGFAD